MKYNFISHIQCNNKTNTIIKSDRGLIDFKLESRNSFIQVDNLSLGPYFIDGCSIKVRPLNLDCISHSSSL